MPFTLNTEGLEEDQIAVLNSDAVKKALEASYTFSHDTDEKPLRQARDALIQEKRAIQAQLDEVQQLGGTEALKKAKELETTAKKKDTEVTTKDEQINQLTKMVNDMRQQNINNQLQNLISKEIRDAGGVPELLEAQIRQRVKPDLDENGNLKVQVLDENKSQGWVVDGRDANVKDLVSSFKAAPTFQRAFDAEKNSGGGSPPGGSRSPTSVEPNPFAEATKNVTKQGMLINTDRPRAIRLAEAAGVKLEGLNA